MRLAVLDGPVSNAVRSTSLFENQAWLRLCVCSESDGSFDGPLSTITKVLFPKSYVDAMGTFFQ